jgi:hypothetical protein
MLRRRTHLLAIPTFTGNALVSVRGFIGILRLSSAGASAGGSSVLASFLINASLL